MTRTYLLRMAGRALVWAGVLGASGVAAQGQKPPAQAPAPAVSAGGTLDLTLEDAVRRAVNHNPDLAVVRLGTDADAARVAESRSAYVPVFTSALGRSNTAAAPSSLLPGVAGIQTNDWFSSAGVQQRLSWGGGTWSASWDAARTASNSPFTVFNPTLQSGLQLAFSQPIFKDRTIDAARLQYTIAKRDVASSDLRFRQAVVQTVAAVKQAYWTFEATSANVTVQQRSLDLAEDLVRQNRARVNVGDAPPLDLVQAQAEVASRRETLIQAQAADKDAEDGLRRLIMDPADASFWQVHLRPVDEPAADAAPVDVDRAVSSALDGRYDLSLARQDLDNAITNVKFFANQKLPDVRLEASYQGGGFGGTQLVRTGPFPGTVTGTVSNGFGDVLGQMFGQSYPTWSLGVTVSYPIGSSYEQAGLARAEVQRQQAAHTIESLQLQIVQAIRQAARQVQSTSERIDAARASQDLAQQRVDVETRRFQAGLSTTFLVTQAQRDLLQAQVNLLQATLDHESALVTFEAVQLAAAPGSQTTIGVSNANVIALPPASPKGLFRSGGQ